MRGRETGAGVKTREIGAKRGAEMEAERRRGFLAKLARFGRKW